jgi:hypothetical protein
MEGSAEQRASQGYPPVLSALLRDFHTAEEELPHLVMIRVQHRNGIFRATPCGVPPCHSLLLPLLYMQRHASYFEGHDRIVLSVLLLLQAMCHRYL